MPRIRRHLVPALLFGVIAFVCWKLLLTPVWDDIDVDHGWSASPPPASHRGWPWDYGEADSIENGWMLAADVAVLAVAGGIAWLLLARAWYRRRFPFRFSLRASLLLVAHAALSTAWWATWYRDWHYEQWIV